MIVVIEKDQKPQEIVLNFLDLVDKRWKRFVCFFHESWMNSPLTATVRVLMKLWHQTADHCVWDVWVLSETCTYSNSFTAVDWLISPIHFNALPVETYLDWGGWLWWQVEDTDLPNGWKDIYGFWFVNFTTIKSRTIFWPPFDRIDLKACVLKGTTWVTYKS